MAERQLKPDCMETEEERIRIDILHETPSTAIINPAELHEGVQPWETWGTEAEVSQSAICTAINPDDETKGEGKGDRGVKGDETEVEDNFKGSN